MNKDSDGDQFLVRTRDGLDYARVEPWQGGRPAAEEGARKIRGYVVALDKNLCEERDHTGKPVIVADYRVQATSGGFTALSNIEITPEEYRTAVKVINAHRQCDWGPVFFEDKAEAIERKQATA